MTNNIFPFESEEFCYMISEPMSDASLSEHFFISDYKELEQDGSLTQCEDEADKKTKIFLYQI